MKPNPILYAAIRLIVYGLLMYGVAQLIFMDAASPLGDSYFSEVSRTEITQEVILILISGIFMWLGFKWRAIQPVANVASLFFLMSFIREFNNFFVHWIYPVALVLLVLIWLVFRDRKRIINATSELFATPASAWLISGFLITYIFSRLFGRGKFWLILYNEENYRMAKNVAEEGIELLGYSLLFVAAIELILYYLFEVKGREKA